MNSARRKYTAIIAVGCIAIAVIALLCGKFWLDAGASTDLEDADSISALTQSSVPNYTENILAKFKPFETTTYTGTGDQNLDISKKYDTAFLLTFSYDGPANPPLPERNILGHHYYHDELFTLSCTYGPCGTGPQLTRDQIRQLPIGFLVRAADLNTLRFCTGELTRLGENCVQTDLISRPWQNDPKSDPQLSTLQAKRSFQTPPYRGTVFYCGSLRGLEIISDGSWTATLNPVSKARKMSEITTGTSEDVLINPNAGIDDNWLIEHDSDITITDLINQESGSNKEIYKKAGQGSQTIKVPHSPVLIGIRCNSNCNWSIKVQAPESGE